MKILFAISMSIILTALQGALTCQYGPSPLREPLTAQAAVQSIINHEANTIWDKKFDRYASYWLEKFQSDVTEDIRTINNLRVHQASAWAQPNHYRKGKRKLSTNMFSIETIDMSSLNPTELINPAILQH